MSQSNIVDRIAPLIALPVILTILLKIFGDDGFGRFSDDEAIIMVLSSALIAIIYLQTKQSSNKLRTVIIHAVVIAAFTLMLLGEALTRDPNSVGAFSFSFKVNLGFYLFLIANCTVSYIILATRILAQVFTIRSKSSVPDVTTSKKLGLSTRDISIFVIYGVSEIYIVYFGQVLFSESTSNHELILFFMFLIPEALNIVLQVKHSGKLRQTIVVHSILIGIAIVAWVVFGGLSRINSHSVSESSNSWAMLLMLLSVFYWLTSYIVLGIVMYINSARKEAN